ncbi:MAG: DUF3891 family protein [Acidobacteriota bacterium]
MDPMIVVEQERGLEIITQNDHARLAGQILELMPALASHPRRDSLILAGHLHDVGWQEIDSAPSVDAQGAPYDFLSQPTTTRLEIWQRSVQRVLDKDRHAGLLVVLHASRLYTESLRRSSDEAVRDELERLNELQDALFVELDVTADTARSDYGWLDLVDLLSLVACNRWTTPLKRQLPDGTELEICWDGDALRLEPLLLAGDTTLRVPQREFERRSFGESLEYAMALATARWKERDVPIRGRRKDIL